MHCIVPQESKPGYIGLINLGMGLRDKCQHWSNFVRELAEDRCAVIGGERVT